MCDPQDHYIRVEVIDGKNGILVPVFDVGQWADRVVDAVQRREHYRSMREAARQFVIENCDADKICLLMSVLRGDESIVPRPEKKRFWPGKAREPAAAQEKAVARGTKIKTKSARNRKE